MSRTRVYTASKLGQAARWRQLAIDRPDVEFTARWTSYAGWPVDDPRHIADSPENAVRFWVEDEEDVCRADAVLVLAEGDEHLRGALVEAGIGIRAGKLVIVVGEHKDYGTWQYHPQVRRVATVDDALALAVAFVAPETVPFDDSFLGDYHCETGTCSSTEDCIRRPRCDDPPGSF